MIFTPARFSFLISRKHCFLASAIFLAAPYLLTAQAGAGRVQFFKSNTPAFDGYTKSPDAHTKKWLNDHIARMMVFTPYFDSRTAWYPNAWVYIDSYAIYTKAKGSEVRAEDHPDWVLKGVEGDPRFIPFGCKDGNCPQYAADVSNQAYRQNWIANARATVARGYKGIFVDDVNLEFRVGDNYGKEKPPFDRQKGQTMQVADWRRYMAEFMEDIRRGLPGVELVHNSIWFAGGAQRDRDPSVIRQIQAADYVDLERGISDTGITGGTGPFSLNAFLAYIDHVHALGRNVIFDERVDNGEYPVAGYLLVNNGRDLLGNQRDATPDHWYPGYDVDLGDAKGDRYNWKGLLRRDFTGGVVLLNPPQGGTVTVSVPGNWVGIDGQPAQSVTLAARQGKVLMGK